MRMRWKESVFLFLTSCLMTCRAKGGGGKAGKSSGGIDSTTDRKIEYGMYAVGELKLFMSRDFYKVT